MADAYFSFSLHPNGGRLKPGCHQVIDTVRRGEIQISIQHFRVVLLLFPMSQFQCTTQMTAKRERWVRCSSDLVCPRAVVAPAEQGTLWRPSCDSLVTLRYGCLRNPTRAHCVKGGWIELVADTDLEREYLRSGDHSEVVAIDEVGRGSAAGPLAVGAVLLNLNELNLLPAGLDDSKRLRPMKREEFARAITGVGIRCATGFATVTEIDELGLTRALQLASGRAVVGLQVASNAVVLLDGKHNFLRVGCADTDSEAGPSGWNFRLNAPHSQPSWAPERVVTVMGGDGRCASIAAASIIAKVERDRFMISVSRLLPDYALDSNKGYLTESHRRAISQLGLSQLHRRSWRISS